MCTRGLKLDVAPLGGFRAAQRPCRATRRRSSCSAALSDSPAVLASTLLVWGAPPPLVLIARSNCSVTFTDTNPSLRAGRHTVRAWGEQGKLNTAVNGLKGARERVIQSLLHTSPRSLRQTAAVFRTQQGGLRNDLRERQGLQQEAGRRRLVRIRDASSSKPHSEVAHKTKTVGGQRVPGRQSSTGKH